MVSKTGISSQNYDNRIVIYRGVVTSPIYGYPNQPNGYVEFSLENMAMIDKISLLDAVVGLNGRVDAADLSNEEKSSISPFTSIITGGIIDVKEVHRGKRNPIVIGKSGQSISRTSTSNVTNIPM